LIVTNCMRKFFLDDDDADCNQHPFNHRRWKITRECTGLHKTKHQLKKSRDYHCDEKGFISEVSYRCENDRDETCCRTSYTNMRAAETSHHNTGDHATNDSCKWRSTTRHSNAKTQRQGNEEYNKPRPEITFYVFSINFHC